MAITMMLMLFNVVHQTIYSRHVFRKWRPRSRNLRLLHCFTITANCNARDNTIPAY